MCECGCSSGPDFFLPGPDGITYGIEFYRGCRDCDAPPGVTLSRIPTEALRDFGGPDMCPEPPWLPVLRDTWREYSRPLWDTDALKAVMRGVMQGAVEMAEDDVFDTLAADVLYDDTLEGEWRALVFPDSPKESPRDG